MGERNMNFLAIQISGDRNATSIGDDGSCIGCLLPVAADGFYLRQDDAEDAAAFMADEKRGCQTYVVKVVKVIRGQR